MKEETGRNAANDNLSRGGDDGDDWRRNLWAIWFAELVAIVGFTIALPLLPLYVRELGVEGEQQVAIWSGAVFSAQAVTMAIFGPIWGALSDRYGRKVMVERAMLAGTFIMALMGLAQSPLQLIVLRALQGALTGTITAARALVATSAPRNRAGYALGTLQMAVYVGAMAGPTLGGVIADTIGYRQAFFVTSGLLLTAAVVVFILVEEPPAAASAMTGTASSDGDKKATLRSRALNQLSPVLGSAPMLAVLGVGLLVQSAARIAQPTLPLFVETIAPVDARIATITGLVIGASALGGALGGRTLGALGDRVGHRVILIACALSSVICYAPQSMVPTWLWLLPLQLGAGFAMGGTVASIGASLAALAPQGREGVVYGIDATAVSIASAIGPASGSLLAAWVGLRTPFLAAAAVFALGAVTAFKRMPDLRTPQMETRPSTHHPDGARLPKPCKQTAGCGGRCGAGRT